jgi:hypothetical protein
LTIDGVLLEANVIYLYALVLHNHDAIDLSWFSVNHLLQPQDKLLWFLHELYWWGLHIESLASKNHRGQIRAYNALVISMEILTWNKLFVRIVERQLLFAFVEENHRWIDNIVYAVLFRLLYLLKANSEAATKHILDFFYTFFNGFIGSPQHVFCLDVHRYQTVMDIVEVYVCNDLLWIEWRKSQ